MKTTLVECAWVWWEPKQLQLQMFTCPNQPTGYEWISALNTLYNSALQSQTAVTSYFQSKHLLLCPFVMHSYTNIQTQLRMETDTLIYQCNNTR